jgi:hypothetical protein
MKGFKEPECFLRVRVLDSPIPNLKFVFIFLSTTAVLSGSTLNKNGKVFSKTIDLYVTIV